MNKKKKSILGLVFIIGFFIYFICTFIDQQKIIYVNNVKIKNIEDKIYSEQCINEEFKKYKDILDSDEYIEKIAREKLGMVKSGEKIFIDIDR